MMNSIKESESSKIHASIIENRILKLKEKQVKINLEEKAIEIPIVINLEGKRFWHSKHFLFTIFISIVELIALAVVLIPFLISILSPDAPITIILVLILVSIQIFKFIHICLDHSRGHMLYSCSYLHHDGYHWPWNKQRAWKPIQRQWVK